MISCQEMAALEEKAFQKGATPEGLMEEVGLRMARFLLEEFPETGTVVAYLGKGHNAGDALVVARHLQSAGWRVKLRLAFPAEELAALTRRKLDELGPCAEEERLHRGPLLLLDGLVGIGATGSLRSPLDAMAKEMNQLRRSQHGKVVAMDIPSGLHGDTGQGGEVIADYTLTVAVPKQGLVADEAIDFVGRLELIPVPELPLPSSGARLIDENRVRELLSPVPFSRHKGQAGRVGILAGSSGMWGAAVLCANGALRGGAGLITLYVEEEGVALVSPLLKPEIMVQVRPKDWRTVKGDVLVIGPGLGQDEEDGERLLELLAERDGPVVLDADGLNLVATAGRVASLGDGVLLTPHPGEMRRLTSATGTRAERARALAEQSGSTVLFKGARTVVTDESLQLCYNTTGHPGMATGGQGDTLSGVLGALLARGLRPQEAAEAGAWLCGRAAEIALRERESAESLTPTAVAESLGSAFRSLALQG